MTERLRDRRSRAAMTAPQKTAKDVWPQVTAFYAARHNEPAWHDAEGPHHACAQGDRASATG